MKKTLLVSGLAFGLVGVVHAQGTDKAKAPAADKAKAGSAMGAAGQPAAAAEAMPAPPKPGPETEALKPFAKNMTWTGKAPAGSMGPGSPEMPTKGSARCKWTINNLWAMCDIESTMGTGKEAMKWSAHEVFGWDFMAKEYHASMVDSFGALVEMTGKLEGQKLTWETPKEVMMMGKPTKLRVTMDATDPKAIKFTSEHTAAGGKWMTDEESVMKTK